MSSKSRTITAATVDEARGQFRFDRLDLDRPRPNEVLVRIDAVGMCHADLAARDGAFPFPLPAVLGHEGTGVVEEAGAQVVRLRPGDRVVLTFDSCGHCLGCLSGHPSRCTDFYSRNFGHGGRPDGTTALRRGELAIHSNFFGQSSFATHALATERNAVRVDDAPAHLLAPLGCAVQTGVGAMFNVLRPGPTDRVAIFGAGAVGLSAVMAASLLGVHDLTVVDINASRLQLAVDLGATRTIDASREDPVELILRSTGGGADFALESSGVPSVFLHAVSATRSGGVTGVVGAPPFGTTAPLDIAAVVNNSRSIIGIVEGDSNPAMFLPLLSRLLTEGRLPVERITQCFQFDEINTAAEAAHTGTAIKPVLTMA